MRLENEIGRPQHVHRVNSEQEYRAAASRFLDLNGQPAVLRERNAEQQPAAYISDGRWVCDCDCGNCPSASPEWGIAICFECGSVWRPIIPREAEAAELVLLERPNPRNRHYLPAERPAVRKGLMRAETLDDIKNENVSHGLPVPDEVAVIEERIAAEIAAEEVVTTEPVVKTTEEGGMTDGMVDS